MVPGNIPIAVQLSGPRGPALRLERAKGVSVKNLNKTRKFPERWTEKEHDKFLEGVEALGKGRYKEIAERFVTTRTHQQVRDHAKNHFKKLGEVASSEKYAETKWSAEEHARFLKGLEKYGKGNWKAISDNLVPARTRQQVTSHAVKYFRKIGEPFSDKGYKSAPAKKAHISAPATVKAKAKIRKRKRGAPRGKDRPLSRNWPAESLVALTGRY